MTGVQTCALPICDGHRLLRLGIDPSTGAPVRHDGVLALARGGGPFSGTPVRAGGCWWYPLRMKGLLKDAGGTPELLEGEPGTACEVSGSVACAGVGGLWVDGRWEAHADWGRIFPPWRPPLGATVAPWEGGLVVLRPRGGALPARGAGPARLPPGDYADLVETAEGLQAVAEGETPVLVPVRPGPPTPP